MARTLTERVLLIGDADRQMHAALSLAIPSARVTNVANVFDGIAELVAGTYTTVLAAVEPIERRPESAVKALRQHAPEGRLVLFGHPTLEPLSRKMLQFGCDDYVVTPASAGELSQIFGVPPLRIATDAAAPDEPLVTAAPSQASLLLGAPIAELVLDALTQHPNDAPAAAVRLINDRLGPAMRLSYLRPGAAAPAEEEAMAVLDHAVRAGGEEAGRLVMQVPRDEQQSAARHFLAQLAQLIGKLAALGDRHARLQKLAITDELTGAYNGRYFRHFLTRIIERARTMRFPVTLLLFDIDDFKKYNDQYGHAVGDQILRETAALMRRCVRDHDLVARIGGDEFAVVFWEKEGPRQPREGRQALSTRVPQAPRQILERFQRLVSSPDFGNLGATGRGTLSISGGLAVFPYDAQEVESLIEAADQLLVFGAKQNGKNSIVLVGDEPPLSEPQE